MATAKAIGSSRFCCEVLSGQLRRRLELPTVAMPLQRSTFQPHGVNAYSSTVSPAMICVKSSASDDARLQDPVGGDAKRRRAVRYITRRD